MDRITHAMRREYWIATIRECNESGMMKKDWLAERGINPKAFYRWQKKLRMEAGTELILANQNAITETAPPDFCQLNVPDNTDVHQGAVIRNDHFSIELKEDISDEFLLRIMKAASHV